MNLQQLQTPALLLDRTVLCRNLESMAARARRLGVSLRPHVKTHKCVEVASLQAACGAAGFTVSTLAEARVLADAGFHDLTWALPLPWPSIPAAVDLCRELRFRLLVDSEDTARRLAQAAAAAGVRPHVWLKVDCGYHRAGVDPADPASVSLVRLLNRWASLQFDGLLTHAGHAYHAPDAGERLRIAVEERSAVLELATRARKEGLSVPALSLGSTPTMTIVEDLSDIDEVRPGNYAYFDLTQVALGSCGLKDVALSVLATVISSSGSPARAV
ncbi:MAG: alanine racemase, partial [Acidobacteriota bacterium]